MENFINNIFSVAEDNFADVALELFHFQYQHNKVYRQWVQSFDVDIFSVKNISQVPFLPVSFFKTNEIVSGKFQPQKIFESSGTTQTQNSRHLVKDISIYEESFLRGFSRFYGNIQDWCIIGLLPAYLERSGSSLVLMVDELIRRSGHSKSGFYLYEYEQLAETLRELEKANQKTLLIGVTFALLDFAEKFPMHLKHTIVMETGGMKGRRKEMIRQEVHDTLIKQLGVSEVHSEYGMTELLSQAYSTGNGVFKTVPWMKVLLREDDDPLVIKEEGRGVINVIDLANIYSCSFIATDDVGNLFSDGSFEVLGRMDHADIRGCSLLTV